MKYPAVAQAVKRSRKALADDRERTGYVSKLKREMSII